MTALRDKARAFAIERHGDQLYGDRPYAVHLAAVEQVLVDHGFVTDHWRAAAWLHDVLEDTPATFEEIDSHFGGLIAEMVHAVTGVGVNRADRTGSILGKLRLRPAACALKVADRIANVEAAANSPRHLSLYRYEQPSFTRVCKAEVPRAMWDHLERALSDPSRARSTQQPAEDVDWRDMPEAP